MSLPSDMDGDDDDFGSNDGTDLFLKHFSPNDADAAKPSETGEDDDRDDQSDGPDAAQSAEGPDGAADDAEADKANRKYADDDATYVKVKVGDDEHEVSVKDLKRLWGQESALTQKSQQVADQRKAVEAEQTRYVTAAATLLDRAQARFAPYAKIDFLLAAQQLAPEEYTALRNEAQAAHNDVKFLESEVNGIVKQISERSQSTLVEQAKAAIKVLGGDPKDGGIEGWGEKLYDDIRSYGVKSGIDTGIMNQLVDPAAIRLIHKAMLFDRGKSKTLTTKVDKTPKRVIKTSTNPDATRKITKGGQGEQAMERLRREGSSDATEAAFLARWAS